MIIMYFVSNYFIIIVFALSIRLYNYVIITSNLSTSYTIITAMWIALIIIVYDS